MFDCRDVVESVTRKERARHCRRQTRGVETTINLIGELIDRMRDRTNLLGVKLYEWEDMQNILAVECKHVSCIQDVPGEFLIYCCI